MKASRELSELYGIGHATLQFESGDPAYPCVLAPADVVEGPQPVLAVPLGALARPGMAHEHDDRVGVVLLGCAVGGDLRGQLRCGRGLLVGVGDVRLGGCGVSCGERVGPGPVGDEGGELLPDPAGAERVDPCDGVAVLVVALCHESHRLVEVGRAPGIDEHP